MHVPSTVAWLILSPFLPGPTSNLHFQMVLSPGPTPASRLLIPRRLQALPEAESEPPPLILGLDVLAPTILILRRGFTTTLACEVLACSVCSFNNYLMMRLIGYDNLRV
jgi:hypothetical protein